MTKEYKSFEEIDRHLKVLKLQREIDQESLKLHFHRAKVDLIPSKLLHGIGKTFTQKGILKNMLVTIVIEKVLGILRKKYQKQIQE